MPNTVVGHEQVDKDGANPERVKQELSEAGLLPEEWGGKTPMIPVGLESCSTLVLCNIGQPDSKERKGVRAISKPFECTLCTGAQRKLQLMRSMCNRHSQHQLSS